MGHVRSRPSRANRPGVGQDRLLEAVARLGRGVLETFSAIVTLTIENLSRRYRMMRLAEGQTVEGRTAQAPPSQPPGAAYSRASGVIKVRRVPRSGQHTDDREAGPVGADGAVSRR